jgi:hypothetical protein
MIGIIASLAIVAGLIAIFWCGLFDQPDRV